MKKYLPYISIIRNQLIVLGLVLLFKFLVFFHLLPNEKYFLDLLNELFNKYGVGAVAIASFFENLIGVGAYLPGSIVILTAMALTAGNIPKALLTFCFIVIPSAIAHSANYFIGRNISKYNKLKDNNIYWFLFSTLWHPHFAAVSTFTMGSQKMGFLKFLYYFIPIHLLWNIFWGITMFYIGKLGTTNFSFLNLFYVYMTIWILWDLIKFYKKQNK